MGDTYLLQRPSTFPPTFPQFPQLPTEIRIQIWAHASNFPRLIELLYCSVDHQLLTLQNPPALLHANRESREVVLTYYHLSFSTPKKAATTYFNSYADILYFGSRHVATEALNLIEVLRPGAKSLPPTQRVRKVAISEHVWDSRILEISPFLHPFIDRATFSSSMGRKFFKSFPHLEELNYVVKIPRKVGRKVERSAEKDEGLFTDYAGICVKYLEELKDVKYKEGLELLMKENGELREKLGLRMPKVEIRFMEFGFN